MSGFTAKQIVVNCHQEMSPRKGNLREDFCSFCFLVLVLLGFREKQKNTVSDEHFDVRGKCRGLFWWQICTPFNKPPEMVPN